MKKEEGVGLRIPTEEDKNLWFDFTNELRKDGKTVWDVLKVFIKSYMRKRR